MKKIPITDMQKQFIEGYQEQIETLSLELSDQEEVARVLKSINDRLEQRNKENGDRIASYQSALNERNYTTARCTSLESEVKRLTADLKTETSNRDHFRQLVAQQDAFIKEAKRQIEEYKVKRDAELKSKTNEAEHLAKQAIRLNEENSKLRTDNVELTAKSNQLNNQTPLLMEENKKFKEQTTRLIEEKRKLTDKLADLDCQSIAPGSFVCGGCVNCQLQQAEHFLSNTNKMLSKRDDELAHERNVSIKWWQLIEILTEAIKTLRDWPPFSPFAKRKFIVETQSKVDVLRDEVEKMRQEFYKK